MFVKAIDCAAEFTRPVHMIGTLLRLFSSPSRSGNSLLR